MKERCNTTLELADAAMLFYRTPQPEAALLEQHLSESARAALQDFLTDSVTISWDRATIASLIKQLLAKHKLKMPQLAMPLRLVVTGQLHTPSIDAVLELFGRDTVTKRIAKFL